MVPFLKRPCQNLPLQNQIALFFICCTFNLPLEYLSYQVNLSPSTIHGTFHNILDLMYCKLKFLITIHERDHIRKTIPPVFKQYFPELTNIFDCFENLIERPKNPKIRAQVYSNYKKHSIVKYLISCGPFGAVTFLSLGYSGRATDIQIVWELGFISSKYHCPGNQLLADRGFTLEKDFAAECNSELFKPSFTRGEKQLTAKEV